MSDRERPVVVGMGEVLWDMLPGGKKMGGAPANFAYHARAIGADSYAISCVGDDPLGQELLDRFVQLGLSRRYVAVDRHHPTGTVDVHLDADGKPYFVIHEEVAWDYMPPNPLFHEVIDVADAVCFGSLAQRSPVSRATIGELLGAVPDTCYCIFDVNLRQRFYSRDVIFCGLKAADVLKLNDDELPVIAELLKLPGQDDDAWMSALLSGFDLELLVLTRGSHGSVLLGPTGRSEHDGFPAEVADTVGAGDAFTATVAMGLLRGLELDAINEHANRVASFVCGQSGATPELPDELTTPLRR
jgi:fructokinase